MPREDPFIRRAQLRSLARQFTLLYVALLSNAVSPRVPLRRRAALAPRHTAGHLAAVRVLSRPPLEPARRRRARRSRRHPTSSHRDGRGRRRVRALHDLVVRAVALRRRRGGTRRDRVLPVDHDRRDDVLPGAPALRGAGPRRPGGRADGRRAAPARLRVHLDHRLGSARHLDRGWRFNASSYYRDFRRLNQALQELASLSLANERAARIDSLTGIGNRREFFQALDAAVGENGRRRPGRRD